MIKINKALARHLSLQAISRYYCYEPHMMINHQAMLTIRATRRRFLANTVLNQNKNVIQAETRLPEHTVISLKEQGKCPGVILPLSGRKDEEVDVVLGGKEMRTRIKSPHYGLQRAWVRVEGKEYCCVLRQVRMNVKHFIEKVFLQHYVPGEPNPLRVPLFFSHLQNSKFYHQGYEYDMPISFVNIVCYNYEYPTTFYIDVSYVNPDRPYTLGDLANTFPPGVLLAPHQDPAKVVFFFRKPEVGLSNDQNIEEIMANVNYGKQSKDSAKPAAGTGTTPAATGAAATSATPAPKKGK